MFASGALAVLFDDSLSSRCSNLDIEALPHARDRRRHDDSYLANAAWRHRHLLSCLAFSALFIAGTALVVYTSAGRQNEATMLTAAQHDELVLQRLALEKSLGGDRASISEKREAADDECKSGEGRRCLSARTTVAFYENSAKGTEARLALMEPAKPVAPEAETIGNAAATLGYSKERVRAISILLEPFAKTLFLEFGSIVSFGFGCSPRRKFRAGRRGSRRVSERFEFLADGSGSGRFENS